MKKGLWIIAYGNPERKDDGCGWRVAERLRSSLPQGADLRTMHQLDPVLVEELRDAEQVVFVDAALQGTVNGSGWQRVKPETGFLPPLTHHLSPSLFMGLVLSVWGRCPEAWLVSIEGCDFGFGQGLSPEAEERVGRISSEIEAFAAGEQKS